MITKKQIKDGISLGIIRFIIDPNMESGTVCAIGDTWFYFGGETAEQENPEEYLKNVPMSSIVNDIYQVLEDFKSQESFVDEYYYCKTILDKS